MSNREAIVVTWGGRHYAAVLTDNNVCECYGHSGLVNFKSKIPEDFGGSFRKFVITEINRLEEN